MTGFLTCLITAVALGGEPAPIGLPLGIPPGPDDPVMQRVAPADCLLYLSWTATAAPNAASKNVTEQLLAEPELQELFGAIGKSIAFQFEAEGDRKLYSKEVLSCCNHILTHPTAIFVETPKSSHDAPSLGQTSAVVKTGGPLRMTLQDNSAAVNPIPPDIRLGAICSLGHDAATFRAALDAYFLLNKELDGLKISRVTIDGTTWYRTGDLDIFGKKRTALLGFRNDYLIFCLGEGVLEGMLARWDHEPPSWLAAAIAQTPVPRRTNFGYLNLEALHDFLLDGVTKEKREAADRSLALLGLSNAKSLTMTGGMDDVGLISKMHLTIEGPPRGVLDAIDGRPLELSDLAPIPRDATYAVATRVDLRKFLECYLSTAERTSPGGRAEAMKVFDEYVKDTGFNIDRFLGALGDRWCFYNSPGEGGFAVIGVTAIVNIRDRAAVLEEINKLRTVEKKIAKDSKNPDKEPSTGEQDTIATVQFAGHEVYYYSDGEHPGVPCWCVTEHEFVVALNIPSIKAFLNRRNHQSLTKSPIVSRVISGQEKPLALGYLDTPKLFELFYPFVTMATPGTARAMGGKKAGIDPSFWPSATAISRHLQSETTTIQRTSDGFESTTHYFVPWVGNVAEYYISLSLPLADILPKEYVPFVSPPYRGPIMRPIADGGKPAPPPERLKPKQPTSPPEPRYSPTFPPPALQPKDK